MSSDWQKVQSALRGDRRALESLVREHLRPTYAVAYALTGAVADSEEIVQEAFARALRGLHGFRPDGRFGAWLVGIVRHIVSDRRRESARRQRALGVWAEERAMERSPETAERAVEREEAFEVLGRAIERLPEDLREPLLLYYVEDLSTRKVAERLALEPAAVRKRLQRARDCLGREMETALGAAIGFLVPSAELEATVLATIVPPLADPTATETAMPSAPASPASPARVIPSRMVASAVLAAGLSVAVVVGALWLLRSGRQDDSPPREGSAAARSDTDAPDTPLARSLPAEPADPAPVVPADRRVSVRGRVVDLVTSRAISGARVSFLDNVGSGSGASVGDASTDGAGRFHFEGPVPPDVVRVHIRADKEGYASTTWSSAFNPRAVVKDKVLRLQPAVPVDGIVVLEGNEPSSGGAVFCYHALTEETDRYVGRFERYAGLPVNGRGRFRVRVWGDRAAILAVVPGHVPAFSAPFEPMRLDGPIVVRLRRGRRLEGKIIDGSERPVAGAWVVASVTPNGVDRSFGRRLTAGRARTDREGRFRLDGLTEFPTLKVSHCDFQSASFHAVPVGSDVTLELAPARWLTFVPVVAEGEQVPAATAELSRGRGGGSAFASFFRSEGVLRSVGLGPEAMRAMVVVPGFLPAEVEWPAGTGAHDLGKVEIRPGLSLCVRVIDGSGRAVPGAVVRLMPHSHGRFGVSTDERGVCRLDNVVPGEHELGVACPEYLPVAKDLVVEASDTVHTVQLERGAALVARIVEPDGKPVAGATLQAFDARIDEDFGRGVEIHGADPWSSGKSDSDGVIRLSGIPPGFALYLVCSSASHAPTALEADPIEPGEDLDVGRIVLDRGESLRVTVRDASGAAVPFTTVTVAEEVRHHWWSHVSRRAQTDAFGVVEETGLPAGVYSVSTSSLGRAQRSSVTIEIDGGGAHEVDIVLTDVMTYAGTVVYEDGEPLAGGTIRLDFPERPKTVDYNATIETGGWFFFKELPPGGPVDIHVLYGEMRERIDKRSVEELPEMIVVPRGASLGLEVSVDDGQEPPQQVRGTLTYDGRDRPVETSFWRADDFKVADLPSGRATASFEAVGFQTSGEAQAVELAVERVTRVPVRLARERPERIVVDVSGPGSQPVADAGVYLYDAGSRREVAHTGIDGTATLEWTDQRGGTLLVQAEGFAMARVPRPAETAVDGRLPVTLAPETVVVVTVLNENGEPANAGSVTIQMKEHIGIGGGIYRSSPIREGSARLDALPAGKYQLCFLTNNVSWGTLEADLGVGEMRTLEFRVPEPLDLHGRVLHNGRPVAGGRLSFRGHRASPQFEIDGTGRYRARLFAKGKYTVWAFISDEHGELDQMIDVEVGESGELDIEVRTLTFDGRLVERQSGLPVGKAWLKLAGGDVFEGPSGEDGTFSLRRVRPGKYRWRVYRWVGEEVDHLGRGEITLQADTTATLEVDRR